MPAPNHCPSYRQRVAAGLERVVVVVYYWRRQIWICKGRERARRGSLGVVAYCGGRRAVDDDDDVSILDALLLAVGIGILGPE